jgi:hypothetical protein
MVLKHSVSHIPITNDEALVNLLDERARIGHTVLSIMSVAETDDTWPMFVVVFQWEEE